MSIRLAAGVLVVWAGLASAAPAECPLDEPAAPRLLLVALDGVSLRLVEEARQRGAFAGWREPIGLISTFPSMTNVAFTAMFDRFGTGRIAGYETRHFDAEANRLIGGGGSSGYAWKGLFQVVTDTFRDKKALYLSAARYSRRMLREVEQALFAEPERPVVLAHVAPTDMLSHLQGDAATLEVVLEVDEMLGRAVRAHRRRLGRDLEVVLLSDHGNGATGVDYTDGLRDALRAAGFRFRERLEEPGDLVAPTYGAVNYGALYLDPERAGEAALAAIGHESVELAAWLEGDGRLAVAGEEGRALVRWTGDREARSFAYRALEGDPLRLLPARDLLRRRGRLDPAGFATAADWLDATRDGDYPDPLGRLVDSLTGAWVANPATVLLSLGPRWAWGQRSVRLGARLKGGRLEGTHGGLDRESSLGFLMATHRSVAAGGAVSAESALEPWSDLSGCFER